MNPFNYTPISFILDIQNPKFEKELKEFFGYYQQLQENIKSNKKRNKENSS